MAELLDIVDEEGRPLGRALPRDVVHRSGAWHRTAHVWITNGRREVLMQKRSMNKDTHPGCWDISAAGHVDAGGTPLTSAIRETREELRLVVGASELEHLCVVCQSYRCEEAGIRDNEVVDVYLVVRDLDTVDLLPCAEEVDEVRWVSVDVLRRLVAAHDRSLVPHEEEYRRLFQRLGDWTLCR